MSIEYKLGRIEEELIYVNPHKFIVVKDQNMLVFHSLSSHSLSSDYQHRSHKDIVAMLGIDDKDVLGAGHVQLTASDKKAYVLRIYGTSQDYGSVPNQILRRFPLKQMLAAYRTLEPGIESIVFDTFGTEKKHWAKYGLEEENGQEGASSV